MKRLLAALLAGAAVFSIAFASAALLEVRGETIQAGVDTDVTCDSDGVDANWGLETDDNTVRSLRVDGIDAACNGAELFASVNGDDAKKAETTISGGQATVKFASPYYTPEEINNVKIWIEG